MGLLSGRVLRAAKHLAGEGQFFTNPIYPDQQLFRLVRLEPISHADQEEILKIWPDYRNVPWYGKA